MLFAFLFWEARWATNDLCWMGLVRLASAGTATKLAAPRFAGCEA